MTQPKHTPEPWKPFFPQLNCFKIMNEEGVIIAEFSREEDMRRATSCVNAMAGIENPQEFVEAAKELLKCTVRCMNVLTEPGIMDKDELDYLKEEIAKKTDGAITRTEKAFGGEK